MTNIKTTLYELRQIAADITSDYFSEIYHAVIFNESDIDTDKIILECFEAAFGEDTGTVLYHIYATKYWIDGKDAKEYKIKIDDEFVYRSYLGLDTKEDIPSYVNWVKEHMW